jgi:hypothetical protein
MHPFYASSMGRAASQDWTDRQTRRYDAYGHTIDVAGEVGKAYFGARSGGGVTDMLGGILGGGQTQTTVGASQGADATGLILLGGGAILVTLVALKLSGRL